MERSNKILIFSDMDGTLLDHYTYSFEPAVALLNTLEVNDIPVIPVSSKTKAELLHIRQDLNNVHPFIVENGAAVFIPIDYFPNQPGDTEIVDSYWVKSFVKPREHWQKLLDGLADNYSANFKTFEQIDVSGIIEMTGLDYDSAVRASQRQFGEPVAWYGSEYQKHNFISELTDSGAQVLHGGRFMHVSGACDKGKALKWLTAQYQHANPNLTLISIAAGDSQNDQAMLEQADNALLIHSPTHPFPKIQRQDQAIYRSENDGPYGWVEGITHILSTQNISL